MSPEPPSIRVQVVLFRQQLGEVWRLTHAVGAVARMALATSHARDVSLAFGDSSPMPLLGGEDLAALQEMTASSGLGTLTYDFFNANLGSSGGSNRLASVAVEDFILVLNPDTYPAPTLLTKLLVAFRDPRIGAADARQIPLEHPKDFDPVSGDTSWVSGSCMLVRADVFGAVGGFDDTHFLLYCDDVDFSWRVRLKGFRTVHVPAAVVFHDKRIQPSGTVAPAPLEAYHGALARLMLARKYGREDLVERTVAALERDGSHSQKAALEEWRRREVRGAVPSPIPEAAQVAQFIDAEYARHRF